MKGARSSAEEENERLKRELSKLQRRGRFLAKFYEDHGGDEEDLKEHDNDDDDDDDDDGQMDVAWELREAAIKAESGRVSAVEAMMSGSGCTASGCALALQTNVTLEYTRDSPMFRRSLEGFETAVAGVGDFCGELARRTRRWAASQKKADEEARDLADWSQRREHSRCLFSRAHASLGSLGENCGEFAQTMRSEASKRTALACSLEDLASKMETFVKEELGDVAGFRAKVWSLGEVYERSLCELLRGTTGSSKTRELELDRTRFERARFALVRYLNRLDATKKLVLTEALSEATELLLPSEKQQTRRALAVEQRRASVDDRLWEVLRDRLEAELAGELPPPGAPAGARSSAAASSSAPSWSAALTTEVLSASTAEASVKDLAHARDEAVLKQGYLHSKQGNGLIEGFLGLLSRSREWHRLHKGVLYAVIDTGMRKVVELSGCSIVLGRRSKARELLSGAFAFGVLKPDGHLLAFQAENDDELIKWLTALRRSTRLSLDSRGATQKNDVVFDTANAGLIAAFVAANPLCADCSSEEVEWVATAAGCTLCADCATCHRKLTPHAARLRSLWLDTWSPAMLRYLSRSRGNERANAVWEHSRKEQWEKPTPDSALHAKEQWIVAKYFWAGFLASPEEDPSQAASQAAAEGDVQSLASALAHKTADIDYRDENQRTALHRAVLNGQTDAVAFLLLNGADLSAEDDDHETAFTIASLATTPHSREIAALILEYQDLW